MPKPGDDASLCPCQVAAIEAMIQAPHPWANEGELATGDEESKRAVAEGLAALARDGLAMTWEKTREGKALSGGPYHALTPEGARRARAIIVEGAEEQPGWRQTIVGEDGTLVRVAELLRRPIHVPRGHRMLTLQHPELVVDGRSGPQQAVDEYGEPITIMGVDVKIDKRLRRGPSARKIRRKKARP